MRTAQRSRRGVREQHTVPYSKKHPDILSTLQKIYLQAAGYITSYSAMERLRAAPGSMLRFPLTEKVKRNFISGTAGEHLLKKAEYLHAEALWLPGDGRLGAEPVFSGNTYRPDTVSGLYERRNLLPGAVTY